MSFSVLRVINDDVIAPGKGFGTHGHSDMEIITYILRGELEHKDSLGTGSVIRPGDVQRMSAGTGIRHSEFNPSADEAVHLLQIWILPSKAGIQPSYEQKFFTEDARRGHLRLVASQNGHEGSVSLHQDMRLYAAILHEDAPVSWHLKAGRCAYLHVAQGALELNGQDLGAGDAAQIVNETELVLSHASQAELLLFDLPIVD